MNASRDPTIQISHSSAVVKKVIQHSHVKQSLCHEKHTPAQTLASSFML